MFSIPRWGCETSRAPFVMRADYMYGNDTAARLTNDNWKLVPRKVSPRAEKGDCVIDAAMTAANTSATNFEDREARETICWAVLKAEGKVWHMYLPVSTNQRHEGGGGLG